MWEWFFSNEVWVIIASVIVLAFILLSFRRQIKQNTAETVGLKPTKSKVLSLGLWAAGSVSLFIAVTALIASAVIQRGTGFATISASIEHTLNGSAD